MPNQKCWAGGGGGAEIMLRERLTVVKKHFVCTLFVVLIILFSKFLQLCIGLKQDFTLNLRQD
jgi:hypothetical protein